MSTVGSVNVTLVSLNLPGTRLAGNAVQRLVNTDPLLRIPAMPPNILCIAALVVACHCLWLALMLRRTAHRITLLAYYLQAAFTASGRFPYGLINVIVYAWQGRRPLLSRPRCCKNYPVSGRLSMMSSTGNQTGGQRLCPLGVPEWPLIV